MLPSVLQFDQHVQAIDGVLARLKAVEEYGETIRLLQERCARARCLALLDLYEELGRDGRRSRYHEIAMATGISMSRVQQLLADARLWRIMEPERG